MRFAGLPVSDRPDVTWPRAGAAVRGQVTSGLVAAAGNLRKLGSQRHGYAAKIDSASVMNEDSSRASHP